MNDYQWSVIQALIRVFLKYTNWEGYGDKAIYRNDILLLRKALTTNAEGK